MFGKILDAIDGFARWVDRRFGVLGEEIPADIRICWDRFWRIIDYIPAIWHDWDFNCEPGIFELIKKKLERLEPEIIHHIHAERDRRRIRICIILLDRIIHGYYRNEFDKKHEAKWGELDWHFEGPYLRFTRPKAITEEEKEQEAKEHWEGIQRAEAQTQRAIDFVMKTVGKWAQYWSD
jgi:hypothetical protein